MKINNQFVNKQDIKNKKLNNTKKNLNKSNEETKNKLLNTLKLLGIMGGAVVAIGCIKNSNTNSNIKSSELSQNNSSKKADDKKDDDTFKNDDGFSHNEDNGDDNNESAKIILALRTDGGCEELYELPDGKILTPSEFHFPGMYIPTDSTKPTDCPKKLSDNELEQNCDTGLNINDEKKSFNDVDYLIVSAINSVDDSGQMSDNLLNNEKYKNLLSMFRLNINNDYEESERKNIKEDNLPYFLMSVMSSVIGNIEPSTSKDIVLFINELLDKLYHNGSCTKIRYEGLLKILNNNLNKNQSISYYCSESDEDINTEEKNYYEEECLNTDEYEYT